MIHESDAPYAVDPDIVPKKKLYTGDEIPVIGLGTFGSDSVDAQTVAGVVEKAVTTGYRHFDCASVYSNEQEIGAVFKKTFSDGRHDRKDFWITSKVWNDRHDSVIESCRESLAALKLDYLDLYLVHWPFPNYHPPHCDVTSRSPNAKPYIHESYMKTWRQMEQLVEMGLVRNIGTSNMTIPKLELVLRDAAIKPSCNEMELHPHFQQQELFHYCLDHDIQPIGYSPLGSPGRPERDRTSDDSYDLGDPVIVDIAQKHHTTTAAICIAWAVQRGQIPIPFSVNHYADNMRAAVDLQLSEDEMAGIAAIDRNCRLIKGQVFLWKEDQGWEALWDMDGDITPP